MKEYKLTWIKCEKKISKNNKPYFALSVKVEGDDAYYNGFGNEECAGWMVGDIKTLKLYEKEYNGKMYKSVDVPRPIDILSARVDRLEKENGRLTTHEPTQEPTKDEMPTDLPWEENEAINN